MPGVAHAVRPPRTARKKAVSLAGSLRPGSASVPLALSTANGRAAAIASPTLSGVEAAREHQRRRRPRAGGELPVEALAGAAGAARRVGVEQVEVGVEAPQAAHLGGVAHAHRLHHPAAGAPRGLAAVGRALVAVQLEHRERAAVGGDARPRRAWRSRTRPATSSRRCSSAPISSASSIGQARGLPGQKISPSAQAPSSTAGGVVGRVMPQILTRVMARQWWQAGSCGLGQLERRSASGDCSA